MSELITRPIREADLEVVVQFVHDLAEYEKSAYECHMTVEQLRSALFCESPALWGYVAEIDGRVVGFVLWFVNFSTWTGTHGMYAEDMYVVPEYRGHGIGRALFRILGEGCRRKGYTRLQWSTLNWNTDTISFVTSLGAVPMGEWTVYQISGRKLAELGGVTGSC